MGYSDYQEQLEYIQLPIKTISKLDHFYENEIFSHRILLIY